MTAPAHRVFALVGGMLALDRAQREAAERAAATFDAGGIAAAEPVNDVSIHDPSRADDLRAWVERFGGGCG